MLENYADILTVEEVCDILRIGYNSVYKLLKDGSLKCYKNGRIWRIPKAAVIEFIREKSKLKK